MRLLRYFAGKKNGFTLIEIVIVLAIASLLMAIVFLAVGGTQKSRRDAQRKNDLSRVAASLETYSANNQGNYPPSQAAFNAEFSPSGQYFLGSPTTDPLTGTIYTYNGLVAPTASTAAGMSYSVNGRVYTVCIGLEQAASTCRTNP